MSFGEGLFQITPGLWEATRANLSVSPAFRIWEFQADGSRAQSFGSDLHGKSTGSGCFCLEFFPFCAAFQPRIHFSSLALHSNCFGSQFPHPWYFLSLLVQQVFQRCFSSGNLTLHQRMHRKVPYDREGPAPKVKSAEVDKSCFRVLGRSVVPLTKLGRLAEGVFKRIRSALFYMLGVSGTCNASRLK